MNFLFVLIIFSTVSCGFLLRRRGGGVRVGEGIGERGAGGGGDGRAPDPPWRPLCCPFPAASSDQPMG